MCSKFMLKLLLEYVFLGFVIERVRWKSITEVPLPVRYQAVSSKMHA